MTGGRLDGRPTEDLVEIVGEALRRPQADRHGYVRALGLGPAIEEEALSLLGALEQAGGFMDRAGAAAGWALRERPGTVVGRYRLLEQIGEGGFGVVFRAEQTAPVRREVALKIIKLGMDTRAVVARFEAERQALAMMDHPCIAKVLDGGATETGRPYFVMELVRGEPITRYCDSHRLSPAARLELFIQVCRAVQHAHSKGIIHRDLKPGNVLVTEVDGRPVPRVIDFGIAKATDAAREGRGAFTEGRQILGTPEYMSPEQGPGLDVDTRTDVYSLGVVLYELLTGVTPHEPQRLRSAAWDQMLRIIREEDPPRPSTRAVRAAIADRPLRPAADQLRGDLDWITMRCLEKDRARRYQTVDGLAADLERHLSGEPVLAAPPARIYRVRKFVGRHRAGVAAAAFAAASLVAGLAAALWQARVAARERDAADESRRQTEQIAAFQAAQLRDIDPHAMGRRLQEDLLAAAGGSQKPLADLLSGLNLTNVALRTLDRTIFSRSIAAIDAQFSDQPLVRAGLLLTVSDTMANLGLLEGAAAPMRTALDIRRERLGVDAPDTIQAQSSYGALLIRAGKIAEAEGVLTDGLARSQRVFGDESPAAAEFVRNLAMLRLEQSRSVEGAKLAADALRRCERVYGPGDRHTLWAELDVGVAELATEGAAAAEPHFRRAYDGMRALCGADHHDTIKCLDNLANCLRLQHRFAEAEPLLREAIAAMSRMAGDGHPDTLSALHTFGQFLLSRGGPGDLEQAESIFESLLRGRRAALGPSHGDTLSTLYMLGEIRRAAGRNAEAEAPLVEALERLEGANAGNGPLAMMTRLELGRAYAALGKFPQAETQLVTAARALASSGHGGAGRGTNSVQRDLIDLYKAWEQVEPGQGHAEQARRLEAEPGAVEPKDATAPERIGAPR